MIPIILMKTIILMIPIYCATSSPIDKEKEINPKVLYDQRQEGEWNVRAHLDNFIIMIIPTQSLSSSTSSPGLLDFLTKSFPKGSHLKRIKHVKKQNPGPLPEETIHFIESKTAPYHVDLTKSTLKPKEDVLASSHSRPSRGARHYVLTIPEEEEYVLTKYAEPKSAIRKFKKTIKENSKAELKLLGAEHEQCGPGMVRDSYGICRVFKY